MANPMDIFRERGFIYQCTDDDGLTALFSQERVTAYVGFDATASSLHVGSLVPIMALAWLQKLGHRPIALVGGGTTMIGDPSGKTEARKLLSRNDIKQNMEGLKKQLSKYMSFENDQALMADNGDWLLGLNYIDFLRETGRFFSVNRMLTAESYKMRLETGLTFIEFNYQVLQAYDFQILFQTRDCKLQMGGQDQWGNIVAGTDLIRRVTSGQAYGLTFPLLIDPKTGNKFGKTHQGAVWLDAERTPPFEFYQFWRNVDDSVVKDYLGLFTFLPMEEVNRLGAKTGAELNEAKEVLAYEATSITHGREEADKAREAARTAFVAGDADLAGLDLPTTELPAAQLAEGLAVADLFVLAGLAKSKGEARKLIRGGGASINENRVDDENLVVTPADLAEDSLVLRAGKKRYHRLRFI